MKRSKFSLSHYKNLTMKMGAVVPIGLTEVLPGDTIQHASSLLVRMAAMMAPPMHPVHMKVYHFFVPNRILWDDWEDFITGGPDGIDNSVFPTVKLTSEVDGSGTGDVGSLADYLGCPTGIDNLEVNALPFRAYNLIWNEYFRDADLQEEVAISLDSGPDTTTALDLLHSCWEKDYFTSARPWEQKGPEVTIPLGTQAPIRGIFGQGNAVNANNPSMFDTEGNVLGTKPRIEVGAGSSLKFIGLLTKGTGDVSATNHLDIYADLTEATGITMSQLRLAAAMQRYAENRARFGSRYHEYLAALGVRSSDARLQRPEYLGGGRETLQFSEVLQTAEGSSPVGTIRGHGIGAMRSNRYRKFFEEHGFVLSFAVCRPKAMYVDGLARHWNRRLREDFYQPEYAAIGQQKVLNKEVYANHSSPDGTFGYQDRYDEYRRAESTVAGEFRNDMLNYWHFAREFGSAPALNADFVDCTPTMRPFASTNTDPLMVFCNHNIQARRIVVPTGRSYLF